MFEIPCTIETCGAFAATATRGIRANSELMRVIFIHIRVYVRRGLIQVDRRRGSLSTRERERERERETESARRFSHIISGVARRAREPPPAPFGARCETSHVTNECIREYIAIPGGVSGLRDETDVASRTCVE